MRTIRITVPDDYDFTPGNSPIGDAINALYLAVFGTPGTDYSERVATVDSVAIPLDTAVKV